MLLLCICGHIMLFSMLSFQKFTGFWFFLSLFPLLTVGVTMPNTWFSIKNQSCFSYIHSIIFLQFIVLVLLNTCPGLAFSSMFLTGASLLINHGVLFQWLPLPTLFRCSLVGENNVRACQIYSQDISVSWTGCVGPSMRSMYWLDWFFVVLWLLLKVH